MQPLSGRADVDGMGEVALQGDWNMETLPEGREMRMPSDVGSSVKPCPMVASGGSCSVVCSVRPMSWNAGSSHCAGLGITMPTLGKLPK